MQERDLLTLPLKSSTNPRQTAAPRRIHVLKRISFEPGLMRSGVVAADHKADAGTALLFIKGAPSKMKPMLRKRTLPRDFQEVHGSNALETDVRDGASCLLTRSAYRVRSRARLGCLCCVRFARMF